MDDARRLARNMGIKPGRLSKTELIRKIQMAEGSLVCFKPGTCECPNDDCLWRGDCVAGEH